MILSAISALSENQVPSAGSDFLSQLEYDLAHFDVSDELANRPHMSFWMEEVTMPCHVFFFT
jgi:hypothetical protein